MDDGHRKRRTEDVTRRDFFKTVGAGSIATAVVAGVQDVEAQGPPELVLTHGESRTAPYLRAWLAHEE